MNPKKWLAIGVVLLIGIGGIVLVNLDWTPKEEVLSEHEASFDEELSRLEAAETTAAEVVAVSEETTLAPVETSTSRIVSDSTTNIGDEDSTKAMVTTNNEENTTKFQETTASGTSVSEKTSVEVPVTTSPSPTNASDGEVKDGWVQEAIDENRDVIDSGDLAVGSDIYNRLDTIYLLDLADGGLTDDEKVEVDQYLNSVLSPGEIEIAWQLYNKYVHLLNE